MADQANAKGEHFVGKQYLKFVIPSVIGALLFLVPLRVGGELTLLLSVIIDATKKLLGSSLLEISIAIITISGILSIIGKIKPDLYKGYMKTLFVPSTFMFIVRLAALVLAYIVYFEIGPEFVWSKNTGGLMLRELITSLIPFFFWAGIFLPFLTDFGLMEFIGMLLRKVFRPIFKIPGRAAVDCAASWIGSGTVGVVITDLQYRNGYYTGKEAIAIATGFSVVSFPIVILFTEFLGIRDLFFTLYLCVIIVGVITNIITVRIPPISRKPNTYWDKAPKQGLEENVVDKQTGPFKRAVRSATRRASKKREEMFLVSGLKVVGDVWFSLMPIVLALGVVVTVIAEYTPVFQWISFPFIYILQIFGLEEAAQAAPSLVVGFADIFLPFILGSSLTSVLTKFVIGVVALVQLIFMTEIGAILLKSPMPIGILDLVIIFLERTLIALPMAVGLGYLLIA